MFFPLKISLVCGAEYTGRIEPWSRVKGEGECTTKRESIQGVDVRLAHE